MRRSILVTMDNSNWPEIDFALYLYDPEEKGKIAPKIQRTSLYDTAYPNCEVHASNAMREICSDLIKNGKEEAAYARQIPQRPEAWQKGKEGHGRIWEGKAPQRKQKRPKGDRPQAGPSHSIFSAAKGKAKKKVKPRGMTKWYAPARRKS